MRFRLFQDGFLAIAVGMLVGWGRMALIGLLAASVGLHIQGLVGGNVATTSFTCGI